MLQNTKQGPIEYNFITAGFNKTFLGFRWSKSHHEMTNPMTLWNLNIGACAKMMLESRLDLVLLTLTAAAMERSKYLFHSCFRPRLYTTLRKDDTKQNIMSMN